LRFLSGNPIVSNFGLYLTNVARKPKAVRLAVAVGLRIG